MKNLIIAAVVIGSLTACYGNSPQPVVYQQPQQAQVIAAPGYVQPMYQQPVIVHDNSGSNLVAGMMLGHMMSGGGSSRQTTVVNRTTVIHAAPTRSYSYSAPSRSYSAPSSSGFRRR